jgi:hypothetical protein
VIHSEAANAYRRSATEEGEGLARAEPFRTLLEEARVTESSGSASSSPGVAQHLEPATPAGRTPERGRRVPSVPLRFAPPDSAPRPLRAPPVPATPAATAAAVWLLQELELEATIPTLTAPARSVPVSSEALRSSETPHASDAGAHAELYRLQLEFEDTPARPLPALASLFPVPVLQAPSATTTPAFVDDGDAPGADASSLEELEELEGIEDLDALAKGLGLKGIEVSIPDAAPVDDEPPLPPAMTSDGPRLLIEDTLVEKRLATTSSPPRPPPLVRTATPVIVKIPSRPKVSTEARARARKLYLSAVDELTRGDRASAIGHLKLAVACDDGVPLYQDFLQQLTKSREDEAPVITEPSRLRRRNT